MSPPTWSQVTVAFLLVIVDWAILEVLRLGVGASLVISALRCGAQLIVVTLVLRCVFNVENMWAVARLARRFLQYCCKSEWHTDGYQYQYF
jgi:ABC-type iron transport system FetAB permease component